MQKSNLEHTFFFFFFSRTQQLRLMPTAREVLRNEGEKMWKYHSPSSKKAPNHLPPRRNYADSKYFQIETLKIIFISSRFSHLKFTCLVQRLFISNEVKDNSKEIVFQFNKKMVSHSFYIRCLAFLNNGVYQKPYFQKSKKE